MRHTKQQLIDIVIIACEGGSNYWAKIRDYDPDKGLATFYEWDYDENKAVNIHKVNPSVIRKGLKLALESEHEHIRFIAVTDIPDAEEADIIIQLGLLGEIVYG